MDYTHIGLSIATHPKGTLKHCASHTLVLGSYHMYADTRAQKLAHTLPLFNPQIVLFNSSDRYI